MQSPAQGDARRVCVLAGSVVLGGALLAASAAVAAPKTDVIVLVNDDHITGEIKSLDHNQLKVSTDHMGTVYVEWDKIKRVQTDQYLLLERADGARFYGRLAPGTEDRQLQVVADAQGRPDAVDMVAIVRARPIEGGDLIDRLDGYVSAGFDVSQAGDNSSLNFAGGLSSRSRIREWNVDGSMTVTDDGADRSERYEVSTVNRRLMRGQNYYEGHLGFTRNTELDLNLRSSVGGGVGRYFLRSNRAEWLGGAGLAYSHENYVNQDPLDSLELLLGTQFSVFRYDFPETDLGGSLYLLPSLTESGRVRAEGELHVKYEFVEDLFFELRTYGSYDSEPPGEDAERSDYGVTTSLGYKF